MLEVPHILSLLKIITGRISDIVRRRAEELEAKLLYQGVTDKLSVLEKIVKEQNCSLKEVIYVGDDINDLSCLEIVGFSACPANAHKDVKNVVNYAATLNGGNGAVREIIDYLNKA